MIDGSRPSRRCALCGEGLDPEEPSFKVPDLLVEMHEACYRLVSNGDFGGAPSSAAN